MTNRYRSACCCDEDTYDSICFLGHGAVPKQNYDVPICSPFNKQLDGFNIHDNWSFCQDDINQHAVLTIDRGDMSGFHPIGLSPPTPNSCDCACLACCSGINGINCRTTPEDQIVVWYKHPFQTTDSSKGSDVPTHFLEPNDAGEGQRLYYWSSYSREDFKISPRYARDNTYPCGCVPHKYSSAVGCASDYYCREIWPGYCGYDINDRQMVWWPDTNGNRSYLTQSQVDMIGHPDDEPWNVNKWGWIPEGGGCGIDEDGEGFGFAVLEGSPNRGYNNDYLYLSDVVANSFGENGKWFRHYRAEGVYQGSEQVRVVPVWGWGTCDSQPWGLWPLVQTFVGVMHREKWFQQYWNSISITDVCGPDPDDITDCLDAIPQDPNNPDVRDWMAADLFPGFFAKRCRTPKYMVQQCAGVPMFSHEIVEKLDQNLNVPPEILATKPDPEALGLVVWIQVDSEDFVAIPCQTLAAYVLARIGTGSGLEPAVTDYMEKVGLLPDPVDYGEEKEYRIFKKGFNYYNANTPQTGDGHCCVNLTELSNYSDDFLSPMYCDCGVPENAIGSDDDDPPGQFGAYRRCGWVGSSAEAELAGITSCWTGYGGLCGDAGDPYRPPDDLDSDLIPDGIECARFVCGATLSPDQSRESYNDFLEYVIQTWNQIPLSSTILQWDPVDGGSVAGEDYEGGTGGLSELLFDYCCKPNPAGADNEWGDDCIAFAQRATIFGECGPPTLCFDIGEGPCRQILGGQFFAGPTCEQTLVPGEIKCIDRLNDRSIGAMCWQEQGPLGGEGGAQRVHCMETSGDVFDSLVEIAESNGGSFSDIIKSDFETWYNQNEDEIGAAIGGGLWNGTDGPPEGQAPFTLDLLYDTLPQNRNATVGRKSVKFTPLANCEPLCSPLNQDKRLNDVARCCDEVNIPKQPGVCDDPVTDYPCQDTIPLEYSEEFYFYGRPGNWRPECGNAGVIDDNVSMFEMFFPSETGPNYGCMGGLENCFSAQAFPVRQFCSEIPDTFNLCPAPNEDGDGVCGLGCNPDTDARCNRFKDESDPLSVGCGPPLFAVCGNGLPSPTNTPPEGYDDNNDADTGAWPGPWSKEDQGTMAYDLMEELCRAENLSGTCYGFWAQAHTTVFDDANPDGECGAPFRYRCGLQNNAFFMKLPVGLTHDQSFCRDYVISYSALDETAEGDPDGGGGPDDSEWVPDPENAVLLKYVNDLLGGRMTFYGGCTQKIIQGDPDAELSDTRDLNTGEVIQSENWNIQVEPRGYVWLDLFVGTPGDESDFEQPGGWRLWVTDPDDAIKVSRNTGNSHTSGNPYEITISCDEFALADQFGDDGIGGQFPDGEPWWGIVTNVDGTQAGLNEARITPFDGTRVENVRALWPSSKEQNQISFNIKEKNPADVPNGLRDYQWYHSPLKREGPLPSARYPDCWNGDLCCGTKQTNQYGLSPIICDFYTANFEHGQPASDSECNYEILLSGVGEGLTPPSDDTDTPDDIEEVPGSVPPEGLVLGAGTNNVARIPEEVQNGSKETMYYVSDWVLGAVEDINIYNSYTDEQLRQLVQNHLNSDQSQTTGASTAPSIPRSEYLNEETTGWIHLDIEEFINLNFISDENPPDPIVYSEERLENWAIGVIRRINAFRHFCPNAKFGLWGFGSPQRSAHDDERFDRQKSKMLFVSNVSHEGQTLFDTVDFLCPVLYQRTEENSSAERRIEEGERARQCIEIVDAMFEQHGETKPVVPTFAFEYEGGSQENQNADRLNSIEMSILKDMNGFSHFQIWHAYYSELARFEEKRDELLGDVGDLTNLSLPEDGILLPDGDLRGWSWMTEYLNKMNKKIDPKYDTGLGHHINLTGSLMANNPAGDRRIVTGNDAGVPGGPTINFASTSSVTLNTLASMSSSDFDLYCSKLAERIKDQFGASVDADSTGKMKSGDLIIGLDPEIYLFDARWEKELSHLCTVNAIIDEEGSFPSGLTISEFEGLYVERDSDGRIVKNEKFEIVKQHCLSILDFMRFKLGHANFYWYNLPVTIFQNNLWRIAANNQFNRPDLLEPIYQYAAEDPDVKIFLDNALLAGMSWYPAHFAHRREIYDSMIEAVGKAFGDRSTMMMFPFFVRPATHTYQDGFDLFSGWSNFEPPNHDPYLISGDITVTTDQQFPITRGMWKYMTDTAIKYNVTPILFPDYAVGANLYTNDNTLTGDVVNVLNQTVGTQIRHTFGVQGDDLVWYDFYFNNLLGDMTSEPIAEERPEVDPYIFTPDKRPMLYLNLAADSDVDTWKVNKSPVDSAGNPIYLKSNPTTAVEPEDDGIKYLVEIQLEKAYKDGYRRMCLRTINGARTGTISRGNGVPSASWSIADPNLGTWNDNTNIRDNPPSGIEYPFTSTGRLRSEDPSAVIGDRQESLRRFLKPWIDSKSDDPVDVYIYDGYQLAFHDSNQTQPARGNLAMTWQNDYPWVDNTDNNQLHFPHADFSIDSHVEFREGEVLPWRDEIGISGFVVDGASRAARSTQAPGYFNFYGDRDLFVMGEAVPMINLGGGQGFIFDPEVIEAAPYQGLYGNNTSGDFWGARDWTDKTPSRNSEIHISLTWGFNGNPNSWSGRHLSGDANVYDIESMKAEIDGMIDAGYVVGPAFGYYDGASPATEAPAREEIIKYIATRSAGLGSFEPFPGEDPTIGGAEESDTGTIEY